MWRRSAPLAAALAALLLVGCKATDPAPTSWQRSAERAQTSPLGAWINVTLTSGKVISGELIAVDDGRIYVGQADLLIPILIGSVRKVTVSRYRADTGAITTGVGLGTLSTVSHGYLLAISAPVWLLAGSSIIRAQSGAGFSRSKELEELRKWARFPQGLPEGFGVVPTAGARGQACYPNDTCNEGLVCDEVEGRCVEPAKLGHERGRCYANGSCEADLVCADARCVKAAPPPEPEP